MGLDGRSVGNRSGITASEVLNSIGSGRGVGEDDVHRVSLAKSGIRRMGSRGMWSGDLTRGCHATSEHVTCHLCLQGLNISYRSAVELASL